MQTTVVKWVPPPMPQLGGGAIAISPRDTYTYYQSYLRQFLVDLRTHFDEITQLLNTGVQGMGPDLVSDPAIVVSNYIHHITGAGTISTIGVAPTVTASHIMLLSDDGFSIDTAGNIMLARGTVPGQALPLVWENRLLKWYPCLP